MRVSTYRKNIIPYYRVSTKHQEESGLGLKAQRAEVAAFARANHATVLREFEEVETGKCKNRPKLREAINLARLTGATLVVAKLDRLARNVAFTSALMESEVDFVCCDNPHATPLTIHIMAAFAEDEARRISQRTKAALAQAKKHGVKLGMHNPVIREKTRGRTGWKKGTERAREIRAGRVKEVYGAILPIIRMLRERNASFQEIADALNKEGYKTTRGKSWSRAVVFQVFSKTSLL
jgi:DNA invertase Pin-like site-specific DNA recombinase